MRLYLSFFSFFLSPLLSSIVTASSLEKHIITLPQSARASQPLTLSNVFSDYAVLQRDVPAKVWGWGNPGEVVSVEVTSAKKQLNYSVTADSSGLFTVTIDPQPVTWNLFNISFQGHAGGGHVVLHDVLFGDVWFCSGQSNMEMPVSYAFNATQNIQAANAYTHAIRLFQAPMVNGSTVPLNQLLGNPRWAPASNVSVPDFSGVCWYGGINMYNQTQVPLGLVAVDWGGTPIQAWSTPESNTACEAPPPNPPSFHNNPSALWNSMVFPFVVSGGLPVKGFAWYQGEQNYGQAVYYKCALPRLINDWRAAFNSTNAFFGVVILAPWIAEQDNNGNITEAADVRLAQINASMLPNVALINAVDDGDPQAPATSIHPRNKELVGARLAASAIALAYRLNPTVGGYLPPQYARAAASISNGVATVTVYFQDSSLYDGLHFVPPQTTGQYSNSSRCPTDLGVGVENCSWFEVQTSDGKWYNATSALGTGGQTLQLSVPVTTNGVTVLSTRYGYSVWPVCNYYNSIGQPLLPWFATVNT